MGVRTTFKMRTCITTNLGYQSEYINSWKIRREKRAGPFLYIYKIDLMYIYILSVPVEREDILITSSD